MRIVQLSDIHLSSSNLQELRNYYVDALINDLKLFHEVLPIDVILFTGDLVDKGGESLLNKEAEVMENCYDIFAREVIDPIKKALNLKDFQILLIPGNHDVQREKIDKYSEPYLIGLDKEGMNEELVANHKEFRTINARIESFKTFEFKFHKSSSNYTYSNNESTYILSENDKSIGFALLNDSWRCSADLKAEHHFMGYNQLWSANKIFKEAKTVFNIAVFHHPLLAFSESEREELELILSSQPYDIVFFGHSHKHEAKSLTSSAGSYFSINGRSAFNSPQEKHSQFQPGYNILDIDVETRAYTLHARKFIRSTGFRFDKDTDSLKDGTEKGFLPNTQSYPEFAKPGESNNEDKNLPNSYSADVHKIVGLLIGKSLYPEPYMFVRELVQNSVDACDRVRKKNTHVHARIEINVNIKENYLEVRDNGDGMTKTILKNHFSVIGKSISQEFSDSSGNFDLISQFGIGFMSIFIVADRVVVDTKNDDDEQIVFEISDVFKGFNYIKPSSENSRTTSGTNIRVYMKSGFKPQEALVKATEYLRHIEGLEIKLDDTTLDVPNNWNVESALYTYEQESSTYILKLGIQPNATPIIASNSGFKIGTDLAEIIPYKFPFIIGGEVNFLPKGIDFDMSRTKVMPTKKAQMFRQELSVALRKLFRDALEGGNEKMVNATVNYLYFYLQHFDTNNAQMQSTYSDFYSKSELVTLCSDFTAFSFQGRSMLLRDIISLMKSNNLSHIFNYNAANLDDYQKILVQYLNSKGYLVFINRGISVNFRDTPQTISISGAMQQIALHHNFKYLELSQVPAELLTDMKMDISKLPVKLQIMLPQIAAENSVMIEVGKFGKVPKSSVRNQNQIFLNYEHETFRSLIEMLDEPEKQIKIYLLGILGLPYHNS
ncbi:MAG: metallophosphoesterase [Bacteroidia bacterium]